MMVILILNLLFGLIEMVSEIADELQRYAVKLTCTLKHHHDFLLSSDYDMLMSLLYSVIDKTDKFISD